MSKSILDFGAVGDGVTDCTDALMQAAVYDGAVYFPEGTYIITRQINTGKTLNWHGEGAKSIIKLLPLCFEGRKRDDKKRVVYQTRMLNMADGEHFEVRNLTFDANKEAYEVAPLPAEDIDRPNSLTTRKCDHIVCIEVNGTDKLVIDQCIIKNAIIEGVFISKTSDICITRSTFTGNGFKEWDSSGLQIYGDFQEIPSIRISDCRFDHNGFNGLLLNRVYGAVVNNISCYGNGYEGVALWNGSSRCLLSNIFCEKNRGGLCFRGDDHGWEADMPLEGAAERCYSTNNVVSGLVTQRNRSGIVWGCAQDIIINGWICRDNYIHELFYKEPDSEISCRITASHLTPTVNEILDRSDAPNVFHPSYD